MRLRLLRRASKAAAATTTAPPTSHHVGASWSMKAAGGAVVRCQASWQSNSPTHSCTPRMIGIGNTFAMRSSNPEAPSATNTPPIMSAPAAISGGPSP